MNPILNSQSLTKNIHAAPGDLLMCFEVLEAWHLGISPRSSWLRSSQGWETCLPLPRTKQVSTPPLLSYPPKLFGAQKQRRGYPSGLSLGRMHRAWAIFSFAAFLCQPTWRDTSPSRASLSVPGAESAFLSFTHFANRWRFSSLSFPFEPFHKIVLYMQCLWKDFVACVKNLEFQLLQWHILHTAFA